MGAVVQVKVGPERTFTIHRGILCRSAAYFRAALEGEFKEAIDQALRLPEDDPDMFSHFELWLYTGSILESHESAKDISWKVLTDICLFGEARGIPELQNEAINAYIDKYHATNEIPTGEFNHIYENTLDSSPLRKLLVDLVTFKGILTDSQWFSEKMQHLYPQQFLFDLAKSFYEHRVGIKKTVTNFKAVRSNYHVHDDGKKEVSHNLDRCHSFLFC